MERSGKLKMMNSNIIESKESVEEQGARNGNEIELTRIRLMRDFVESQDPSSKVLSLVLDSRPPLFSLFFL